MRGTRRGTGATQSAGRGEQVSFVDLCLDANRKLVLELEEMTYQRDAVAEELVRMIVERDVERDAARAQLTAARDAVNE